MDKFLFLFLVISSHLCAADHFDYYDLLVIESNIFAIEEKINKYENVMISEDFGTIKHHIANSKLILNKKIEDILLYVK